MSDPLTRTRVKPGPSGCVYIVAWDRVSHESGPYAEFMTLRGAAWALAILHAADNFEALIYTSDWEREDPEVGMGAHDGFNDEEREQLEDWGLVL